MSTVTLDPKLEKVGFRDLPLGFAMLKKNCTDPDAGGCCVASEFLVATIRVSLSNLEASCTGALYDGASVFNVDELISKEKPVYYKEWMRSKWPYMKYGICTERDSNGNYVQRAAKLVKLNFEPGKLLNPLAKSIFGKWSKCMYTTLQPWYAEQVAYNVMYTVQRECADVCAELLGNLPKPMAWALKESSNGLVSRTGNYKKLIEAIHSENEQRQGTEEENRKRSGRGKKVLESPDGGTGVKAGPAGKTHRRNRKGS